MGNQGGNQAAAGKEKDGTGSGNTSGSATNKNADGGNSKEALRKLKKDAREENKQYTGRLKFISEVNLFKRLPAEELPLLVANMELVEFLRDSTIMKEGEPGHEFFVLLSGEAMVFKTVAGHSKQVAVLKAGDYCGEQALRFEEPRTATVKATEKMVCLKMGRDRFRELGLADKLVFANRKAVGAGGGGREIRTQAPARKTDAEATLITESLRRNENLETMVPLDNERVQSLIEVAWKENVPAGFEIIKEGDLNADYFYIVQEGQFQIFVSGSDEVDSGGQAAESAGAPQLLSTIGPGGSFGELALLYLVPRSTTVKAEVNSIVWVIDRRRFKDILMQVSDTKIAEYQKYVDCVQVLEPLLAEERREVAKALIEMHFAKGEVILTQGDQGNTFYILYEGEASVVIDQKEVKTLKAEGGNAQCFGERALLENEPRAATVTVISEDAKALALDRDSFDLLLGPLKDIITKHAAGDTDRKSAYKGHKTFTAQHRVGEKIRKEDLQRIGLLGCGGFGAVELKEHVKTGQTYAMKMLSKGYIVKTGMQDSVMNEKHILMMTNSPFIIKLHATYNGTQTLYFLLEAALGGELYATYNRKGFHGSEPHATYYSAGVGYAFQHLHERRIMYRDLKPENLLLTEEGCIKLTDMGLAKFVIGKTYTTCGTPDYFAPELIGSLGHTNAVDWWTLGILIFELMSGHPPFEAPQPMQIYSKVMKGINHVNFPLKCQGSVGELIRALLKKEPSERICMKQGGIRNLQEHEWYREQRLDWDAMMNLTQPVPYKPVVKSRKDIANFSARKEDMPRCIEYRDDGTGWDKDFES